MNPGKNSDPSENRVSLSDHIIGFGKVFLFVYLLAAIIGLYVYMRVDKNVPLELDGYDTISSWTVTDPEGNVSVEGSTCKIDEVNDGTYLMDSVLPENISDDSWLFCSISREVEIYIDGEFRKDFNERRDIIIPGGVVKRFYFLVPIDSADSGKDIHIVMHGTSRQGVIYRDVHVSSGLGLVSFMIHNFSRSLILSEILLLFSFVTVIAGIAMRVLYKQRIEMLYGAVGVFVISAWTVSDSLLWPFIYRHYHIDGVFNYFMSLLMPFGLALYLNGLQHGRYKKIMAAGIILSVLDAIVWPVLHFANIFSFPNALIYINIILGVLTVVVLGVLIVDIFRGYAIEYLFTAIGFIGFLICCIVELILIHSVVMLEDADPMLIGLAILLTLTVAQQMHDLRRNREERQRVMEMSEAKTRFLASMSHEIRTPINAILGMNEMILRENNDPVIDEYARSAKTSGKMLLMLVNDVLDFSKIEAGKMVITNAEYKLSSLLRDIYPMLKERADEKKLFLSASILCDVPNGQISDEFRIRQILINLVNNAIKYTDAGFVALEIGGKYNQAGGFDLRFNVKDTGRGIREEDRKTLFDAFARADMKKNRNIEGTGLGLSIVKSIVDSMNGKIYVTSTYGEGSEFSVIIPVGVYDKKPLKQDFMDDKEVSVRKTDKCDFVAPDANILAVDDNNSNLKIVTLFLKRTGIVPDTCDGGIKMLEMCRKKKYDLILLDHMMPEPDGIEALAMLRKDDTSLNKDTVVVVLTANAVDGSRKMYIDAGFADYLTKPIDSALLEATVKKYLPPEKIAPLADQSEPDEGEDEELYEIEKKLSKIEGLDVEVAMNHAGYDEVILEEVVSTIASGCDDMIASLRKALEDEDYDSYHRDAHSVKGLMATIGLSSLSERAKKHEFAARDMDTEFIKKDCEGFLEEYRTVCEKLK
ncbi:MAG: response regulator [Lachnospiraceae bacterium]|nr:response regulator [Lachnospiraceae bacterium]